jgi:hypothetical protein
MSSVMQAGPCVRSNQLDYDEDVMFKVSGANAKLLITQLSLTSRFVTLYGALTTFNRLNSTCTTMSGLTQRRDGHSP